MDHEMTANYIIAPPKEDLRTQREIILAALLSAEREATERACRAVCSCCDNAQLYPLKEVETGNWWHYEDGELYVRCAANSIR